MCSSDLPDMMPNATINRWIDEILMYHFTIRHKAGVTFGPDGLSRRPRQEGDESYEPCSDDEDEPYPKIETVIADQNEPKPLDILDFVDKIDSRGGYFQGIAQGIEEFEIDLDQALSERKLERSRLIKIELDRSDVISTGQKQYLSQLINALSLPTEGEAKDEY